MTKTRPPYVDNPTGVGTEKSRGRPRGTQSATIARAEMVHELRSHGLAHEVVGRILDLVDADNVVIADDGDWFPPGLYDRRRANRRRLDALERRSGFAPAPRDKAKHQAAADALRRAEAVNAKAQRARHECDPLTALGAELDALYAIKDAVAADDDAGVCGLLRLLDETNEGSLKRRIGEITAQLAAHGALSCQRDDPAPDEQDRPRVHSDQPRYLAKASAESGYTTSVQHAIDELEVIDDEWLGRFAQEAAQRRRSGLGLPRTAAGWIPRPAGPLAETLPPTRPGIRLSRRARAWREKLTSRPSPSWHGPPKPAYVGDLPGLMTETPWAKERRRREREERRLLLGETRAEWLQPTPDGDMPEAPPGPCDSAQPKALTRLLVARAKPRTTPIHPRRGAPARAPATVAPHAWDRSRSGTLERGVRALDWGTDSSAPRRRRVLENLAYARAGLRTRTRAQAKELARDLAARSVVVRYVCPLCGGPHPSAKCNGRPLGDVTRAERRPLASPLFERDRRPVANCVAADEVLDEDEAAVLKHWMTVLVRG